MHPAVFLDRDDTLVDNRAATAHTAAPGDLIDPELVRLLPGAGEACSRLQHAGLQLVVITNQGGVAQGLCTLRQVEAVNDRLRRLLRGHGVTLAGVYYSPNRPAPAGVIPRFIGPHPWRKPGPGMLLAAANDLDLDLSRSWTIGDAGRDVEAGVAAGLDPARGLRIGPGHPFTDLAAAAEHVLSAHKP